MDITVNLDHLNAATRQWIEDEARRRSIPLEALLERLIERGIMAEVQADQQPRYHDLDALAGTWSAEDAAEFQSATRDFAQIDPTLWQ
jgi:hypothetical protein